MKISALKIVLEFIESNCRIGARRWTGLDLIWKTRLCLRCLPDFMQWSVTGEMKDTVYQRVSTLYTWDMLIKGGLRLVEKIKLGFPTHALHIILKIYSLKWTVFLLCFVFTDHLRALIRKSISHPWNQEEPNGSNAYPKYYYNITISSVLLYSHNHTPSSLQHHHHKGLCKPHYATLNFWSLVQSFNLLWSKIHNRICDYESIIRGYLHWELLIHYCVL